MDIFMSGTMTLKEKVDTAWRTIPVVFPLALFQALSVFCNITPPAPWRVRGTL